MNDADQHTPQPDDGRWDPNDIMRGRAAEARTARDEAISCLRSEMTDDEILDAFGIDLGEIEQ